MPANDDTSNVEQTADILTFPTEQRRVAVATERQDGNLFTPDELTELISQFVDVDFTDINVTIDNYENSIQYSFEELADNEFKISADDAKSFFKKGNDKSPYTECLETITELLVSVNTLNGQGQDGTLDEVRYQVSDIVKWLYERQK